MGKKVIMILIVLLLPLVLLLTGVEIATRDDGFFEEQYQKNNVMEATGMELDALMEVTEEIQDYLLADREDLVINAEIDGVEQQVFNEREIVHMDDVQVLFKQGILFRNLAGAFLILAILYGLIRKETFVWKALLYGCALLILGGILVGALLYFDFDRYFVLFHEVFFSNDYWILDPRDSILINMVPLPFFISMAQRILTWTAAGMIIVAFVSRIGYGIGGGNE